MLEATVKADPQVNMAAQRVDAIARGFDHAPVIIDRDEVWLASVCADPFSV
jgi:hypothetical protein